MYTVLNNAEMLTREEIKELYDGKWIYLTNCEFTPGSKLIRGIPRVVADKQAEGVNDGIYDVYRDSERFGETYGHNLLDFDYLLKSITFLPKGGSNEADSVRV
ncbi:MAG: hypothetical protein FWH17_07305 [Oscillospiraceae bacterium]|nr:hypothetical protein [Oscillospiraceae bacterium]